MSCGDRRAIASSHTAGNMQSAVDEKKKLELRLDNITGEFNKAKTHVTELESSKQQLQVGWRHAIEPQSPHPILHASQSLLVDCGSVGTPARNDTAD